MLINVFFVSNDYRVYNINIYTVEDKRKIVIIIAIPIIAFFAWYVFFHLKIKVPVKIGGGYQSVEVFSKYLPKEILIESNPQLLRNFTRVEPDGTFYSLVEFSTDKSLEEYFEMYKKELLSNNWKIEPTFNGKYVKIIEAMKEKEKIVFQINYYEQTKKSIIAIHHFDYSSLVFPTSISVPTTDYSPLSLSK